MHMQEINDNYASEYTPHAMANSSMQEQHSDVRSRHESTPLEFHSSMHADAL